MPFEFYFVTISALAYGIHSFIHTTVSRDSVPPIHTPPKPYPDASMNNIYTGNLVSILWNWSVLRLSLVLAASLHPPWICPDLPILILFQVLYLLV